MSDSGIQVQIFYSQQKLMNHICIHTLETQNSVVDEDWTAPRSPWSRSAAAASIAPSTV